MEVQSFVWRLMCFCAVEIARFVVEESSFVGNRPPRVLGEIVLPVFWIHLFGKERGGG